MIKFILTDIEGTTSSISFVHEVLFPYSFEKMESFLTEKWEEAHVQKALEMVAKDAEGVTLTIQSATSLLRKWITEDKKHGGLKEIQGLLWKQGFEEGTYQGHVYPDVRPALEEWKEQGLGLGVYSSGSVQAQKLLFGHSLAGDLTPFFSAYFDTAIGGKKEANSYRAIAKELGLKAENILFLSDIKEELIAAQIAGFCVLQLVRESENNLDFNSKIMAVSSFDEIEAP